MDKKRILGTDLQIAEPEYIQIRVYADLELVALVQGYRAGVKRKDPPVF